ncbi:MAG: hypothetical protein AB7S26_26745 [Sandaracinaceae bacterium]
MAALAAGLVLLTAVAHAQDREVPRELTAPWSDAAPRIEAAVVWSAAVGAPDERIGRFEARRASARRAARARAMGFLHAWADDALAEVHASAAEATAVHAAIDRAARERAVRPLADAGAVIAMEVPLDDLRAACRRTGVPWAG